MLQLCFGESIPVLGTVDVSLKYDEEEVTNPLLVVKGRGQTFQAAIG